MFARAQPIVEVVALGPMNCSRFFVLLGLIVALVAPAATAQEGGGESMTQRKLKELVQRQRELLADAEKQGQKLDEGSFKGQMEDLCRNYEVFLRENPKLAQGFAAYGYLLGKLGQDKEAAVILLKSNELDPNQPLVKNQLGNYLAEQGQPLDALPYFMAAIKLAPNEPLYHYQLGTLLHEARDDFIKSGDWKAEAIDHAVHEAFRHAAELAPDRIEFTYRYAESFYDLAVPEWDAALKEWEKLEKKAPTEVERETMRLHEANVLMKNGEVGEARERLETVREPALQKQKQKLIAQLDADDEK
jgi:tetratricopeptide (TPR) repeat protein